MTPLTDLSAAMQARIAEEVAQEKPPPKWFSFGDSETDAYPMAQIISRGWVEWFLARGRDPFRDVRPKISARLRAAVLERDGMSCQLCGDSIEQGDLHIDHRVPVARGGPTALENLQAAHSFCNMSKGARY